MKYWIFYSLAYLAMPILMIAISFPFIDRPYPKNKKIEEFIQSMTYFFFQGASVMLFVSIALICIMFNKSFMELRNVFEILGLIYLGILLVGFLQAFFFKKKKRKAREPWFYRNLNNNQKNR